jgi:FkbM family methyltransferase
MSFVDYSQFGQSLIIDQLITSDTPQIVVDIGAHDGFMGSNSRALLERGWRGLLVEPLPSAFQSLKANSRTFANVALVEAACSDRTGTASISVGKDGPVPQMSSLSQHPEILGNVTEERITVRTTTLAALFSAYDVPEDFGVLLVDTEGWDLVALRGLDQATARPRIIVTEEFQGTNHEKYAFLSKRGYQFVGSWGCDSFWISSFHPASIASVRLPIHRLPLHWLPTEKPTGIGRVMLDPSVLGFGLIGWAWTDPNRAPEPTVALALQALDSPQQYLFQAWRMPRPDVAAAFGSEKLIMSGYRTAIEVPGGAYELRVIQVGPQVYTNDFSGRLRVARTSQLLDV